MKFVSDVPDINNSWKFIVLLRYITNSETLINWLGKQT